MAAKKSGRKAPKKTGRKTDVSRRFHTVNLWSGVYDRIGRLRDHLKERDERQVSMNEVVSLAVAGLEKKLRMRG